ncbi:MAG: S41 family peptidase [Candidatus Baltobacteraceae bacterium]
MRSMVTGALFLGVLAYPFSIASAASPPMDRSARHAVILRLDQELNDRYVFPDRAAVASKALSAAEAGGAFDALTDPDAFAKAVTAKLAGLLHDKHLGVEYSAEVLPPQSTEAEPTPTPQQRTEIHAFFASRNFGLDKAVQLRGNVGYLDVRGFPPGELMGPTVAAAMQFLSNTDTLIIDLRKNGGGSPSGVALLCSYFLGPNVHINDIYSRTARTTTGKTEQSITSAVPGPLYLKKKIYLLTSYRTFSGGEEFANDLLTQKRATLVGETTGGGANPGGDIRIGDHFSAFIPDGRAINPVTHTNWEGVGVKPDVATTADAALSTAYTNILREKIAVEKDPRERKALSDLLARVAKNPETILLQ